MWHLLEAASNLQDTDFAEVFEPISQEYHGISADAVHTTDMDASKIEGNIDDDVPVKSVRIRVGRSIEGFGLSPGITKYLPGSRAIRVNSSTKTLKEGLESGSTTQHFTKNM